MKNKWCIEILEFEGKKMDLAIKDTVLDSVFNMNQFCKRRVQFEEHTLLINYSKCAYEYDLENSSIRITECEKQKDIYEGEFQVHILNPRSIELHNAKTRVVLRTKKAF